MAPPEPPHGGLEQAPCLGLSFRCSGCGLPRVWLHVPAPTLGSRVQMWLPPSQRLWAWPLLTSQGLSLCTCFCPRGWGSEAVQF